MKTYEELVKEYRKRQHDTVVDTIATGLTYVDEIAVDTGLLEETGLLTELTESVREWKNKRNPYIHDLMNNKITTADLEELALQGWSIVKKLNSSSTNYKRALQKQSEKNTP